ncbi:hypothetical protein [Halorubrum vacuolatum]|uniref:DUF7974 domain-containing protein n=1 Tax=Halorubrum vacuolatum TaxID=63740 RepID=A0A238VNF7_HALVU|nr:hypothetical protein [Halorubrum vacuolatum]SNR35711.1 hypothetical protein SAMN06264855_103165 [Halorubrum vacuolatum]
MDPSRGGRNADALGEDYETSVFSRGFEKLVPAPLARFAATIDVTTDRESYAPGDPVTLRVAINNRLPVPIDVPIAEPRIWGWSIDGLLEATDERTYEPERRQSLSLRAGETRTVEHVWNGYIKRTADGRRTIHEPLARGKHEIRVFLGTNPRKTGSTTVTVR